MSEQESLQSVYKKHGIFMDHPKSGPSTSYGRYSFPRCYFEVGNGKVNMGVPKGPSAADIDMPVMIAAYFRGLDLTEEEDGWFGLKNGIRIHPEDPTVITYSDTVLREDPTYYVPDPREFNSPMGVTNWGIKDRTTNHDCLASMILRQDFLGNRIYKDQADESQMHNNPNMQFIKILEQRKAESIQSEEVQAALAYTYTIKIELCENECNVWRRFQVPASIDLAKLHDQVLSQIMGWSRCKKAHVFEDPKDGTVLGTYPSKGRYSGYMDALAARMDYYYIMDDRNVPLALLLREVGNTCYYTYDLAQQWVHRMILEEILPDNSDTRSSTNTATCLLDGAGACPPEDGIGLDQRGCLGYANFLKAYKKNPKKPKVKEALCKIKVTPNIKPKVQGTCRTKFDPFFFDLNAHCHSLHQSIIGPSLRVKGALGSITYHASTKRGCVACGDRLKATKKCARCFKVAYCSRDCQLKDWKNHKNICNEKK